MAKTITQDPLTRAIDSMYRPDTVEFYVGNAAADSRRAAHRRRICGRSIA
jgi:hypothetical protein